MPWNDASQLIVPGSGQVYVAPVGTALPTTSAASLNSAFVGLGYITTDGVAFAAEPEISEISAWQSRDPIRRDLIGQAKQFTFTLQQWNEENLPFVFGGGTVVDLGGGEYRYDFIEDDDALDEHAIVVDLVDGSTRHRFAFHRGNVTDTVETSFVRESEAGLPVTFKVLSPSTGGSPGSYFTNSADFAAGS